MEPDIAVQLLVLLLVLTLRHYMKCIRGGGRRMWHLPLIARREQHGIFYRLFKELRSGSNPAYCHRDYFRMSKETFDYILLKIEDRIRKEDTVMRKAIPPAMRLAVTLHHLAEGASFNSIKYHWRIGKSTATGIIYETCRAIWEELIPVYMKAPQTIREWKRISTEFMDLWNFPHCLGAVDGKHVRIQCPRNAGSEYFNYKTFHSINLMAICDANLLFTYVDIGQSGRWSDAGVFESSSFGTALHEGRIHLPRDEMLPGFDEPLSYAFVGDEAFPLKDWLMRPYPGRDLTERRRVYNYRLSRARRTIENAFGVMSSRWRLLQRPIIGKPDNAIQLVKAMCVLHNLLRCREGSLYTPPGYVDTDSVPGQWRQHNVPLLEMASVGARNSTASATLMRETFTSYFNSAEGSLEYQVQHVNRTI